MTQKCRSLSDKIGRFHIEMFHHDQSRSSRLAQTDGASLPRAPLTLHTCTLIVSPRSVSAEQNDTEADGSSVPRALCTAEWQWVKHIWCAAKIRERPASRLGPNRAEESWSERQTDGSSRGPLRDPVQSWRESSPNKKHIHATFQSHWYPYSPCPDLVV